MLYVYMKFHYSLTPRFTGVAYVCVYMKNTSYSKPIKTYELPLKISPSTELATPLLLNTLISLNPINFNPILRIAINV